MVNDHQNAIRCFKSAMDESSNGFQILNIKKTDLVEVMRTGMEMSRIEKIAANKKFFKVEII